MSTFLSFYDSNTHKQMPQSIAFEKCSGGIKIFSEKAVNVYLELSDFSSGFEVSIMDSFGDFVEQKFVLFNVSKVPEIDARSNSSSFSFRLKRSSQKCKCYFFMVVRWLSLSNETKYLVGCAMRAFSKNAIFDQSLDACSYLSTNTFTTQSSNTNILLHPTMLVDSIIRRQREFYIVFPSVSTGRSLDPKMVVKAAVVELLKMQQKFCDSLGPSTAHSFSQVYRLVQSFPNSGIVVDVLRSVLSDMRVSYPREEICMEFSSRMARSIGQHMKGCERYAM
jgi:hypothetical protein